MRNTMTIAIFIMLGCALAWTQSVQVNRDNRTISVTAEESVSAEPDVVVAKIAYRNLGPTKQGVYTENVRVAESVVKAFEAAGVAKENVETEALTFGRKGDDEDDHKPNREPRFEARQVWKLRLPAKQAQGVIDAAMRAGANEIEDLDWQVADSSRCKQKPGRPRWQRLDA